MHTTNPDGPKADISKVIDEPDTQVSGKPKGSATGVFISVFWAVGE